MTVARVFALVVSSLALGSAGGSAAGANAQEHVLSDPIRASQQTLLQFGERSHWLQPWRAYLDTVPAQRLVDGLGIVFDPPPGQAQTVAREAAAAGFRRARIEVSWCDVSDTQPAHLVDPGLRRTLLELQRNGLRPLVLLNANDGCPGPLQRFAVHVAQPAPAGARRLVLDAASAARVVPGRTGLDSTARYEAAAFLFTSVNGSTVTLSRPLDHALAPGAYAASTLRYAPFTHQGDPAFADTMQGWLDYVGLVTHAVKAILGNERFDVEVWNELSFASDFLDVDRYYAPPIQPDTERATEEAILAGTVAYIRDPANGVAGVGIGDGFANTQPWDAGSQAPPGLTAIDKHPYPPRLAFPQDAVFGRVRPLDAFGRPEGAQDAQGRWHDAFIPQYTAFFPEYFLTGIQTETAIRDLSPITSTVYGTAHGRNTHPPGGSAPAVWLTEAGMDPASVPLTVRPSFHAKAALRFAVAWVNEGASRVYYFSSSSPGWGIVNPNAPGGGETLAAIHRLTQTLGRGAAPITHPRSLSLRAIASTSDAAQFAGNGTPEYPPLYDRDVVAFFPYQVANGRVVVATYVMTRDLLHAYRPNLPASDPRRYDMPPISFRLTIGGLAGIGRHVSMVDPATGRPCHVRTVVRRGGDLTVDVPLTDSPRLLVLS